MRALVLAVCCACTYVRDVEIFDMRPPLAPIARALAPEASRTAWSQPVRDAFVDDARWLPDGGLFIGWVAKRKAVEGGFEIGPDSWSVQEPGTGVERWRMRRDPTSSIVMTTPAIVVKGQTRLLGLAAATGRARFVVPVTAAAVVSGGPNLLAVVDSGLARGLDPETGVVKWATRLPVGDHPRVSIGATVTIAGDRAVCELDAVSGERRYCASLALRSLPVRDDELRLGREARGVVAFDAAGKVLWRTELELADRELTPAGKQVYVRTRDLRVVALAADTGRERWRSEPLRDDAVVQEFASPILTDRDRLILTTVLAAWTLDNAGKVVAKVKLERANWPRFADQLTLIADQVIIANEVAVLALDRTSGAERWHVRVRGANGGSLGFAKIVAARTLDAPVTTALTARTEVTYAPPLSSNGFAPAGARFEASVHGAQATLAMGAFFFAAMANFEAAVAARLAARRRSTQAFAHALVAHTLALDAFELQGNYYVRPIEWLWGEGVFVLDLRDGTWREVVSGPAENFSHHITIHFPIALVAPDASVITMALGFDPAKWRLDTQFIDFHTPVKSLSAFAPVPGAPLADYAEHSVVKDDTESVASLKLE